MMHILHKNEKLYKAFIALSWAAILSAIALLLLVAYWLFIPYNVADVRQPFLVLNDGKLVNINGKLKLRLVVDKKLDFKPTSSPSIRCESGNLVTLTSTLPSDLPLGKYTIDSDNITIPPKFEVGDRCQYVTVQKWKVNPLREISETYYSEFFIIGEPIK